jgi:hypothetical protein
MENPMIDQEDCMARIEPIIKVLHDCLLDGMAFYQDPENYSAAAIAQQRERTVAGCVNDHAFHRLRELLEGKTGCRFPNIRGLEVLDYQGTALVRLKKVNGAGRGRNAITKQQTNYDAQLPLPGLPPEAIRLVAGYQPDAAFNFVQRVIISRPLGKTILWAAQVVIAEDDISWIDITPARLPETGRTDFGARGRGA